MPHELDAVKKAIQSAVPGVEINDVREVKNDEKNRWAVYFSNGRRNALVKKDDVEVWDRTQGSNARQKIRDAILKSSAGSYAGFDSLSPLSTSS